MTSFFQANQIQIVFIIAATMGGLMHYLKKFLKGETDKKFYEWYGKSNLAATLYTIIVFFFAIVGAIAADVVNSQTGFWAALYSGFVTGFAIDAGFNSAEDPNINRILIENKTDLNTLFTKDDSSLIVERSTTAEVKTEVKTEETEEETPK